MHEENSALEGGEGGYEKGAGLALIRSSAFIAFLHIFFYIFTYVFVYLHIFCVFLYIFLDFLHIKLIV